MFALNVLCIARETSKLRCISPLFSLLVNVQDIQVILTQLHVRRYAVTFQPEKHYTQSIPGQFAQKMLIKNENVTSNKCTYTIAFKVLNGL